MELCADLISIIKNYKQNEIANGADRDGFGLCKDL